MVPGTVKEQITLYDPSITMEDVRAAAQMTGLSDTIMSLETGTIRHVPMKSFHRDSGSYCRSPVQRRQSRNCSF